MKLAADYKGNNRYFSAKLSWGEHFDPKEIEILSVGAIPKLIPPVTVQGRKNNILQYDISAYSTLEFYLTCILSREQFAELLLQITDVFQRMQQIYLSHKNLVLDLNKIYIQLSDRTVHFIYLPLMSSKREVSLPNFFRLMITKTVRSTYEQSSFLNDCLTWLNRPASFVLSEFEGMVKRYICSDDRVNSQVTLSSTVEMQPPSQPVQFVHPAPKASWESEAVFNDCLENKTCCLEHGVGGTVNLGEDRGYSPTVHYYIQRVQPEEKVELTHFPFLVGTEVGSVDFCVSGNAAVSRRHVEFLLRDGACVIVDQKSTNKTYVNNCAIYPFTPQPLKHGDNIRMGNEQFIFLQEEII